VVLVALFARRMGASPTRDAVREAIAAAFSEAKTSQTALMAQCGVGPHAQPTHGTVDAKLLQQNDCRQLWLRALGAETDLESYVASAPLSAYHCALGDAFSAATAATAALVRLVSREHLRGAVGDALGLLHGVAEAAPSA
jgi:hypothetical protein